MKKCVKMVAGLLALVLLAGCIPVQSEQTDAPTEPAAPTTPAAEATTETTVAATQEDVEYEGDASSYYIDVVYAQQIDRYYTALSQQWDETAYYEHEMSALPALYYDGNPLDNVGFGFVDLDNDGYWELVIGAIRDAEINPAVFEIWTLVDGEPVMLLQAGVRNRYILQHVEEDRMWYVAYEGDNGAANYATHYLMLSEGKIEVVQGIVFDAMASEKEPWFLTHDLDWDVSNDEPIDEETAKAILESNRKLYTALELFPYIYY